MCVASDALRYSCKHKGWTTVNHVQQTADICSTWATSNVRVSGSMDSPMNLQKPLTSSTMALKVVVTASALARIVLVRWYAAETSEILDPMLHTSAWVYQIALTYLSDKKFRIC
jgi:hypothetical protein